MVLHEKGEEVSTTEGEKSIRSGDKPGKTLPGDKNEKGREWGKSSSVKKRLRREETNS